MQPRNSGLAELIYELVEQLLMSTEFNAEEIERNLAVCARSWLVFASITKARLRPGPRRCRS